MQSTKQPAAKAIRLLKQQLEQILALRITDRDSPEVEQWREKTRTVIANLFGRPSPQLENFDDIRWGLTVISHMTQDSDWQQAYLGGLGSAEAQLKSLISEVEEFWPKEQEPVGATPIANLEILFGRFQTVARQLRARHDDRTTLEVSDEYDVQDLLHALLRIFFNDVRTEPWTPDYAGGASRMDFILQEHGIVIEVKKTRPNLRAKPLTDQLLVDIMRYKVYPGVKLLVCFVYDPDNFLPNPAGIERDLSKKVDQLDVKCFIRP